MPTTIGKRLKDFIESHGSDCSSGASEARILEFEQKYSVVIPEDLRSYFAELNGTAGDYAYGIVRFWSIDEVRTVKQEIAAATPPDMAVIQAMYSEPIDDGENFFVFADCLHESQLYAIHLSTSDMPNDIILLDGEKPTVVAESFSDFVERYLTAPEDLRLVID
jgi:hypothetical protein